jgi:hypothetical protein
MTERGFWMLADVSDDGLEQGLLRLLRSGAATEARIVAHLAEMDARQLSLRKGQSLWEYCLSRLGLSESEAYYRIGAARLGRRFPLVFGLLERRELHLTAIVLVGRYLTGANHVELLNEARGKSKRQLLELLVRRFPKAGVAEELRRLPVPREALALGPTALLEPRSEDRYALTIELSCAQTAKLERARDLLSHANPQGDLAQVVERALDLLLAQLEQKHFGQPKSGPAPSASSAATGPEERAVRRAHRPHIPHAVRRQVLARDGARCAYIGIDGIRCRERRFLQFHHVVPFVEGGPDTTENLQLVCAVHNRLLAA